MVNDDCQLDWTLDVLRDTPIAGSSLKETHRERKNMHRKKISPRLSVKLLGIYNIWCYKMKGCSSIQVNRERVRDRRPPRHGNEIHDENIKESEQCECMADPISSVPNEKVISKTEPSGVKLEQQCSNIHGIHRATRCYNQIRLMPKQIKCVQF